MSESKTPSDQACQVPLPELLRHVPIDTRLTVEVAWMEDGTCIGHQMIPAGRYAHEAASELTRLQAENEELSIALAALARTHTALLQAREDALEEAAKVCEALVTESNWEVYAGRAREHRPSGMVTVQQCSAAIRALKSAKPSHWKERRDEL